MNEIEKAIERATNKLRPTLEEVAKKENLNGSQTLAVLRKLIAEVVDKLRENPEPPPAYYVDDTDDIDF